MGKIVTTIISDLIKKLIITTKSPSEVTNFYGINISFGLKKF